MTDPDMTDPDDQQQAGLLTSYDELADIVDNLSFLLRETRRARRLSLRAAGDQIGIGCATIYKIEHGEGCQNRNLAKILRWIGGAA